MNVLGILMSMYLRQGQDDWNYLSKRRFVVVCVKVKIIKMEKKTIEISRLTSMILF
jgi:hypothetical protein